MESKRKELIGIWDLEEEDSIEVSDEYDYWIIEFSNNEFENNFLIIFYFSCMIEIHKDRVILGKRYQYMFSDNIGEYLSFYLRGSFAKVYKGLDLHT